jgi:hypothetical protein
MAEIQVQASLGDSLIQEYGVNVDATAPAKLKQTQLLNNARIFEVTLSSLNAYIIDTSPIRRIACHPHVVGAELERLMLESAEITLKAILELAQVDTKRDGVLFEQILRAAPGYQLHNAAEKLIPNLFRTVFIRPRYTHTSYRDHDGVIQRQLEVVYENFTDLQKKSNIVLVMQDTVASSRSAIVSIERVLHHCEKVGSRIRKWIVYGFVSLEGLKLLDRIAQSYGIPLTCFALGNVTALCANNYDMPLFGVDEWLWQKNGSVNKLGALVDRSTFMEYLPEFIPGADQPGDWSARQSRLFTGIGYEDGNIDGHLENSIRLVESLLKIGTFADWQEQIADTELRKMKEKLAGMKSEKLRAART